MPIGGKILDEIDAAIRLRDKLLLILSIGSDVVWRDYFQGDQRSMPPDMMLQCIPTATLRVLIYGVATLTCGHH
jgi:hypothetical protein